MKRKNKIKNNILYVLYINYLNWRRGAIAGEDEGFYLYKSIRNIFDYIDFKDKKKEKDPNEIDWFDTIISSPHTNTNIKQAASKLQSFAGTTASNHSITRPATIYNNTNYNVNGPIQTYPNNIPASYTNVLENINFSFSTDDERIKERGPESEYIYSCNKFMHNIEEFKKRTRMANKLLIINTDYDLLKYLIKKEVPLFVVYPSKEDEDKNKTLMKCNNHSKFMNTISKCTSCVKIQGINDKLPDKFIVREKGVLKELKFIELVNKISERKIRRLR